MGSNPKEQRWDFKRKAKIFSGLKLPEIKKLIFKRLIKEDDLIWHSGLSKWRKAGDEEEIKPFFEKLKNEQRTEDRILTSGF